MKYAALILTVLFAVLTIAGVAYVLLHHGTVSAGHAVVPFVLCIACQGWLARIRKNP